MIAELKISKLDAARRQMETAIRLYFHEADPASIHTLVAAAYTILQDLNKARGGTMMIKDLPELLKGSDLKPGDVEQLRTKLNEAQNFLKHANKDPEGVLSFRPMQTETILYEACIKYREFTSEQNPLFGLYTYW